jgi:glycosyltransferase involved in cell wall biosynthesis
VENHKIIVLLTYYERPELVKEFLRSLLRANEFYDNWELAFIDDGSIQKGRPIAERILKDVLHKVVFYDSRMTPEMKKLGNGSYIGYLMNQAIRESDADLVIMAGDDDEIHPEYMPNLNRFFADRPECMSCYSNVYVFNPLHQRATETHWLYSDDPTWKGHEWFGKPINCAFKVDGIQVCWRRSCSTVHGAWLPYPVKVNHDAIFFQELYDRTDCSVYTGFVSMWKGRHGGQLHTRHEVAMANGIKDKKPKVMML